MNYKTLLTLSACTLMLGCQKQDVSCQSPETLTLVKKMYALQIADLAKSQQDFFLDKASTRQMLDEEVRTALNTIKSKSVKIDNLDITQIETIKAPKADEKSGIYLCKAVISSRWPSAISEKMSRHPILKTENILSAKFVDGKLQHPVLYKSEKNAKDLHEVGIPQPHLFLGVLLRSLLKTGEEKK